MAVDTKKYIILTTIDPPNEAVKKFSEVKGYTFVVVGDQKTPHDDYKSINCIYLHPDEQQSLYPKLSKIIGWNTIQRRNIGFVYAWQNGADVIATVDSDNFISRDDWGQDLLLNKEVNCYTVNCKHECFDPVSFVGGDYVNFWHRGYPLGLVKERNQQWLGGDKKLQTFDIEAQFWTGAADVDSICRSLYGDQVKHYNTLCFPFCANKFSPFNSQNTFISRKVFPNYCVFPFVGRADDWLAGYYCQAKGFKTVYSRPSVEQIRNPHDTTEDMRKEIIGYKINTVEFLQDIKADPENIWMYLPERTKEFFDIYKELFK